jgi:outer membrane protein assembly factor BamB
MIKFLKKLPLVYDFEVKNHTIFILRGEMLSRSVLIYDALFNERVLIENIVIPSFRVISDSLSVYSKGKAFEFLKESNFEKPNVFVNFFPKYKNKNTLIGDFSEEDNSYLQSKNIDNGEIFWTLPISSTIFLIDTQIYLVKFTENLQKREIVVFDFQTGLPLWNYTLPEVEYSQGSNYPPAVSKGIVNILGVYRGIVWIINDIGHLIGLDSETGKCNYHLKTPVNIPTEWGNWEVFVYAKKSYIDTEKGIIFGLDHVYYWECDLNNPTESYLLYDISETSKEHSIVPDLKGNWLGDEIFFGQNSFAQDPGFAGIFNRQTRQITWTSRELGDEGVFKGINKIEYQACRLYVLDKASTLHIFEKA